MTSRWICLEFWICQGSEYARVAHGPEYVSSSEFASVIQGSAENGSSYMFDSFQYSLGYQYTRAGINKGCEYDKVIQDSV